MPLATAIPHHSWVSCSVSSHFARSLPQSRSKAGPRGSGQPWGLAGYGDEGRHRVLQPPRASAGTAVRPPPGPDVKH